MVPVEHGGLSKWSSHRSKVKVVNCCEASRTTSRPGPSDTCDRRSRCDVAEHARGSASKIVPRREFAPVSFRKSANPRGSLRVRKVSGWSEPSRWALTRQTVHTSLSARLADNSTQLANRSAQSQQLPLAAVGWNEVARRDGVVPLKVAEDILEWLGSVNRQDE